MATVNIFGHLLCHSSHDLPEISAQFSKMYTGNFKLCKLVEVMWKIFKISLGFCLFRSLFKSLID